MVTLIQCHMVGGPSADPTEGVVQFEAPSLLLTPEQVAELNRNLVKSTVLTSTQVIRAVDSDWLCMTKQPHMDTPSMYLCTHTCCVSIVTVTLPPPHR